MPNGHASPPAVSILVCAWNAAPFIQETLRSALAQTFRDFELVVIDDGSTDDTSARVLALRDPRLRLIRQPNQGPSAALNAALQASTGACVAFLDHDDLWLPAKLQMHASVLDSRPEVDITFSWSRLIDEHGNDLGLRSRHWRGGISFSQLLADFVIGNTSAVVMRRAAIEEAGAFDPLLDRYYDVDLFLRVALLRPGNVLAIEEELTLYRRRPGQMSADWQRMRQDWDRLLAKMRRIAPAQTASVEPLARANMLRYFAWLAYESGSPSRALALLGQGCRQSPRHFFTDPRNLLLAAAALAAFLLPRRLHQALDHAARRILSPHAPAPGSSPVVRKRTPEVTG